MTWINRLRLFGGMLGVLLRRRRPHPDLQPAPDQGGQPRRHVAADTYDVGAAYGGTVTKQYVKEGDVGGQGRQALHHPERVAAAGRGERSEDDRARAAYDVDTKAAR